MTQIYFKKTDLIEHSVDSIASAKCSMAIESKKEHSSSILQVAQHPRTLRHEYSLLAGVAGGVVSSSLLHPLDTVKIRLAASNGHLELMKMRPHYRGLIDAFKSILRTDGVPGLYRGLSLAVLSSAMNWGSYFFFYDTIKAELQQGDMKIPLGPTMHMAAASSAGLITLVLTNPIFVVKTRLCLQFGPNAQCLSEKKRYKGIMDALIKTYQHEGVRGLYRGFVPGLFGVSYISLQFMTYQEMKNGYNSYLGMSIDSPLSTMTYLSFGATSKLFACTVSYPYQLMRTRLQDQYQEYKGLIDVVSKTWRYEGIRGFYKGLLPQLLRVTPATAITFVVYEKVLHHLTEPVTPHQQHHQQQVASAIQQPAGGTIVSSQSSNGSCSPLVDGTLYKINGPAV